MDFTTSSIVSLMFLIVPIPAAIGLVSWMRGQAKTKPESFAGNSPTGMYKWLCRLAALLATITAWILLMVLVQNLTGSSPDFFVVPSLVFSIAFFCVFNSLAKKHLRSVAQAELKRREGERQKQLWLEQQRLEEEARRQAEAERIAKLRMEEEAKKRAEEQARRLEEERIAAEEKARQDTDAQSQKMVASAAVQEIAGYLCTQLQHVIRTATVTPYMHYIQADLQATVYADRLTFSVYQSAVSHDGTKQAKSLIFSEMDMKPLNRETERNAAAKAISALTQTKIMELCSGEDELPEVTANVQEDTASSVFEIRFRTPNLTYEGQRSWT